MKRALKRRFIQHQRQHLIDIIGDAMHTLTAEYERPPQYNESNKFIGPIQMNGMLFDPEQRKIITCIDTSSPDHPAMRTSELTAHQSALLSYMVLHPQKVLSSLELSREALGYQNLSEIEADRIIRPHILKLRRKIEADPSNPRLIRSIRGKGYLFSPP